MSRHFTHLHLHTDFSLLDGAITLDRLIEFGKKNDFKSLAITDHGNIFGAVKFFEKAKKAGIKPILGIEAYLAQDVKDKSVEKKYYHLILIVQNSIGYKNLCKLIARSYQEGFYFKPRIDYAMLEKHHEGLIATTSCLGGHIPQLLMTGNADQAIDRIAWFKTFFGPGRFYFEVQPEDQPDQKILNTHLYQLSVEHQVPLIATGDCHYVNADDREAHETMLAIQTQAKVTDTNRFTFGDCRVHMRTTTEMLSVFNAHEEAVWNTGVIADSCDFNFETGKLFFPHFEVPQEHTGASFFKHLCEQGLNELITHGRIPQEHIATYQARLATEIELIIRMGFPEYFLVVSDFIQWARRKNIPVGPGRGSAAGSLVAWALGITNIDPIKYNLIFERFLNPERVSMPDIDIDFCIDGREHVITYIKDKYGHDKVCQIITFGTMMAKGVVKDVARALGIPFEDSNAITNLIPDQLKITLKEAIEQEQRLNSLITNNPTVTKLFDLAFRLEGLTRHASKHAAGIVISPEPIEEVLPVYVPPKTQELVTQYAMTELESLGFLKIDLLGLKNLTLIDHTIRLIQEQHQHSINIDAIPIDDPKTFELIQAGNTSGVFQLESNGLKDVLRKLQPSTFEDIIAVNALYRPGPLGSGMVDDFIERRHGRQKISYLFPELSTVLQETYGVIVYQEQVMKIASIIAGYSLGESDLLRRAMGKKKPEEMAKQRSLFLERAQARSYDQTKAGELFDLLAYFAGYGFNKSHSAAYALLAYQTAYLKANYPAEFMACLISLEADNAEKMSEYLQEARDMGLTILPPDINTSAIRFSVSKGNIVFGLQGIKNVGTACLENSIAQRNEGPYKDLLDFCQRVDLRTANKRVIEHLICAGAFDSLPGNRRQKCEELAVIMDQAAEYKKRVATGQMDLFGIQEASDTEFRPYQFKLLDEWDPKTKLEKEREVIGFYVSSHPLDTYKASIRWLGIPSCNQLLARVQAHEGTQEPQVYACGFLKSVRIITTKKGDRMAFIALEDRDGKAEAVIFPRLFNHVESLLIENHVLVIKGALDITSPQLVKIKADSLFPLDTLFEQDKIKGLTITMPTTWNQGFMQEITRELSDGGTPLSLILKEHDKKIIIKTKRRVLLNQQLLQTLEQRDLKIKLLL